MVLLMSNHWFLTMIKPPFFYCKTMVNWNGHTMVLLWSNPGLTPGFAMVKQLHYCGKLKWIYHSLTVGKPWPNDGKTIAKPLFFHVFYFGKTMVWQWLNHYFPIVKQWFYPGKLEQTYHGFTIVKQWFLHSRTMVSLL